MHNFTSTSRTIASAAIAATAVALVPASAGAALLTFGSNLKARATVVEARQADTAYWQTTFADHHSPLAPASGQITSFKIKGHAISNWKPGQIGGETMFHLQALRKRPGGTYKILRTSQAFFLPGKSASAQKVTTYRPTNFCIAKGDVLAFNTVGGWDGVATGKGPFPNGTPLQIFGPGIGSVVSEFMGANKTGNGAIIKGSTKRGKAHELLMQLTVGTGRNGTALCKGGTKG